MTGATTRGVTSIEHTTRGLMSLNTAELSSDPLSFTP